MNGPDGPTSEQWERAVEDLELEVEYLKIKLKEYEDIIDDLHEDKRVFMRRYIQMENTLTDLRRFLEAHVLPVIYFEQKGEGVSDGKDYSQ